MALINLPSLTEQFYSIVKSSNYVRASFDTIKEMGETLIEDAFPSRSSLSGKSPWPDMVVEFPSSIESMLPFLVVSEKTNSPARKDGSKPKEFILILGTTGRTNSYWTRWNLGALAYYSSSYKYDEETGKYISKGVISTNDEMRASGIKTVLDVLNYFKGKRVRCTGFKASYQINEAYDKAPRYLMLSRFFTVWVPQIDIIGKGIGYCFSRNTCTGILNKSQEAVRTLSIPPVSVDRDGIPYEISIIDKYAFNKNTFIEMLNLKNVNEVRDYAFFGCSRLQELAFSDNVKWIGKYAFAGCSSIESISFPYNGPDYLLDAAFKDCTALKVVAFKNAARLTRIGAEAFSGCTRLRQIEIPNTVVEIADHAFQNCISLTQIILPKNIKRIGIGAFEGCINLEKVIIPSNTVDIAPDAFCGCNKYFPDGFIPTTKCENRMTQSKKCPQCGSVFDNPEAIFCNRCGTRLEIAMPSIRANHNTDNLSIHEIIKELQNAVPQIDQIDDFTENGFARFISNEKYGVVDRRGMVCIPPFYRYMFSFNGEERTRGLFDIEGDDPEIDNSDIIEDGRVLFRFKNVDFYDDPLSLIGRVFRHSEDNKGQRVFHLEDASGKRLSNHVFYLIGRFDNNGLCCVSTDPDYETIGAIDTEGRFVVPEIYTNIDTESGDWLGYNSSDGGLLRMFLGDKVGFLDTNGNTIIPFILDNASIFQDGVAEVELDGKWGLMDKKGRWVINPEYDDIDFDSLAGFAQYGLFGAMKDGKWAFVSKDNHPITDFIYDELSPFNEGRARVGVKQYYRTNDGICSKTLFGIINTEGKLLTEIAFDYCSKFSNGFVVVENNQKKMGFVDRDGKMVTGFIYDHCDSFKRGFAIVKQNGLFNIIDTKMNYLSSKWWKKIEYDGCYLLKDENESCQMNSRGEFYLHKYL